MVKLSPARIVGGDERDFVIGERMRQHEREEMARWVRYGAPPQVAVVREAPKL